MLRRFVSLSSAAVVASLVVFASPSGAGAAVSDAILVANLTGAAEVGGGDPDGTGRATLYIDGDSSSICASLRVQNIDPSTAAHVHQAPAGVNGPIVLELPAPKTGQSFECKATSPALLSALVANPGAYYVNVHNAAFPGGAVRGQLSNPYA